MPRGAHRLREPVRRAGCRAARDRRRGASLAEPDELAFAPLAGEAHPLSAARLLAGISVSGVTPGNPARPEGDRAVPMRSTTCILRAGEGRSRTFAEARRVRPSGIREARVAPRSVNQFACEPSATYATGWCRRAASRCSTADSPGAMFAIGGESGVFSAPRPMVMLSQSPSWVCHRAVVEGVPVVERVEQPVVEEQAAGRCRLAGVVEVSTPARARRCRRRPASSNPYPRPPPGGSRRSPTAARTGGWAQARAQRAANGRGRERRWHGRPLPLNDLALDASPREVAVDGLRSPVLRCVEEQDGWYMASSCAGSTAPVCASEAHGSIRKRATTSVGPDLRNGRFTLKRVEDFGSGGQTGYRFTRLSRRRVVDRDRCRHFAQS